MAGYSATPLSRKLGIAAGARVAAVGAPDGYRAALEPLPPDVTFVATVDARCGVVHLFTADRATLAKSLTRCRALLASDAIVWVSWPKKGLEGPDRHHRRRRPRGLPADGIRRRQGLRGGRRVVGTEARRPEGAALSRDKGHIAAR